MRQFIHAEFGADTFDRVLFQDQNSGSGCRLRCYGGAFRNGGSSENDDEAEPPTSFPSEGTAYLDVIFKDGPNTQATLTDLAGDGEALELTVLFPMSHLPWFLAMLDRIEGEDKVLCFFGHIEERAPDQKWSLKTDALARVSDGVFESVSLFGFTPRIVASEAETGSVQ